MKVLVFLLFISFSTYVRAQGMADYIGEPKFLIEKMKEHSKYENVLTGDYFKLSFIINDDESLIKAVLFEFDKSVPSEQTTCQAVYIFIQKTSLDYATLKLKSDYPLYDSEYKVYHNGKIGAKIINKEDKILAEVLYFDYSKFISEN